MIKKFLKDGLSKSAIARKLNISRNTVIKYANKPEGYVPIIIRESKETILDEYLPYIKKMLETAKKNELHIPTTVIFEEIKKQGYEGSLRWLQKIITKYDLREKIKKGELIRFETAPGKQMQVDWVEFPKDKLSAFVATMGFSRASYIEYVKDEKIETLIKCHLNAFRYFGGVPAECLYDNMKTVIIKRNAYGYGKHQLNAMFKDFAKHCDFKIKVCKPYTPQTKGKVERFNHYFRYSFHNGLKIKLAMKNYKLNIDNANCEVLKWLDNTANKRIHCTTLEQPLKLLKDELPHLKKLPEKPYTGVSVNNNLKKDDIAEDIIIDPFLIQHIDIQKYDNLIPIIIMVIHLITITMGIV